MGNAESNVLYKSIGSYSGPVINGTKPAFARTPTMSDEHLFRAFWLTSMVESGGKLGSIMMADGTACTAGLEQVVAVYPRNMKQQGPLFKLLNRMDAIAPIPYYLDFKSIGWFISEDGVLREKSSGKPIEPKVIRDTFTPIGGKVDKGLKGGNPTAWEQSRVWAIGFHQLFSCYDTAALQTSCGIEHFTKFAKRLNSPRLNGDTVEKICYNGEVQNPFVFSSCPEMDLAMALWWNYKTNAPSPALDALHQARTEFSPSAQPTEFSRLLVNKLRTSRYGRWGTNRYDRSREHAMKVWPISLFEGASPFMPTRKV